MTTTELEPILLSLPTVNGPRTLAPGTHHHVILQGGMALGLLPAHPAQGYAMIEGDIVADLGGLADHHPHAVVDEEALADCGAGVDLDAGQESAQVGAEAAEKKEFVLPEPVGDPVEPDGVQPRITENHFQFAARCRVPVEDSLYILLQSIKHRLPFIILDVKVPLTDYHTLLN